MSLIARIEQELKDARLARDEDRRDALSLILASLRSAEKELQRPLSDDEELQVLQRERKRRLEAAEAYEQAGREEQAEAEEFELDVLEEFMPEPLEEAELEDIIDDVIAEVGATSARPRPRDGRRDAAGVGPGGRLDREPARSREARLRRGRVRAERRDFGRQEPRSGDETPRTNANGPVVAAVCRRRAEFVPRSHGFAEREASRVGPGYGLRVVSQRRHAGSVSSSRADQPRPLTARARTGRPAAPDRRRPRVSSTCTLA